MPCQQDYELLISRKVVSMSLSAMPVDFFIIIAIPSTDDNDDIPQTIPVITLGGGSSQ